MLIPRHCTANVAVIGDVIVVCSLQFDPKWERNATFLNRFFLLLLRSVILKLMLLLLRPFIIKLLLLMLLLGK